jgi:predicted protein tyrosine phosphatase
MFVRRPDFCHPSIVSQVQKLLFVCAGNQRRSPTAEWLFEGCNEYEVTSAGTSRGARTMVTQEHIEWADLIFLMEGSQLQELRRQFGKTLKGKRLICLQIPDQYGAMSLELVDVLRERLSLYIALPSEAYRK